MTSLSDELIKFIQQCCFWKIGKGSQELITTKFRDRLTPDQVKSVSAFIEDLVRRIDAQPQEEALPRLIMDPKKKDWMIPIVVALIVRYDVPFLQGEDDILLALYRCGYTDMKDIMRILNRLGLIKIFNDELTIDRVPEYFYESLQKILNYVRSTMRDPSDHNELTTITQIGTPLHIVIVGIIRDTISDTDLLCGLLQQEDLFSFFRYLSDRLDRYNPSDAPSMNYYLIMIMKHLENQRKAEQLRLLILSLLSL